MTTQQEPNVVQVKPQPNIYTVLLIIAILALYTAIGFVGFRLMKPVGTSPDAEGGYGMGVGEMFEPFEAPREAVSPKTPR
jgi:hypothetical protein